MGRRVHELRNLIRRSFPRKIRDELKELAAEGVQGPFAALLKHLGVKAAAVTSGDDEEEDEDEDMMMMGGREDKAAKVCKINIYS